eukprot:2461428-Amphidinium_carterae.2
MDNSTSEFDMVAELALTMREMTTDQDMEENENNEIEEIEKDDNKGIDEIDSKEKNNKDKVYNEESESNDVYDNSEEEMQTLNIYEMKEGTISMMGKMNPNTDKYIVVEVNRLNTTYPQAVGEEEDGYDDYMDMRDHIRKMRGDIVSFSQTLNYVLLHATKPGSEDKESDETIQWFRILETSTVAICGRPPNRAQQFSLLRTIMQPSWTSDTRQFTRQYYKWLEDINRYEAENGHGSITDHVKIATV